MRQEMTETEIRNFALDFNNLISRKSAEIATLKTENRHLSALVSSLQSAGEVLTVEDVRYSKRGVWIEPLGRWSRPGQYAIPLKDGTGVLTGELGRYRYERYGETWVAYAEMPQESGEGMRND